MKRLVKFILGLGLLLSLNPAMADEKRPITVNDLPASSQEFIATHFQAEPISVVWVEGFIDKEYTVLFTNGIKVQFDRKGAWEEIKSKHAALPAEVIPPMIVAHVGERFPQARIISLEQKHRGYKVELSNDLELKFDLKYRLVEIDD